MTCYRAKRWFYSTAVQLRAVGGQTTHVVEVCRVLAQRRPTTLFAPNPPATPIPGLPVCVVPLPPHPPREVLFQARLFRTIVALSKVYRPDVLYHRAASFNLGIVLAGRVLGVPCVMELNGLPAMEYALERAETGPLTWARTRFYRVVERIEHRLADGLVVVTPNLADIVRRNGARQVHVTRNGVDPAAFVPCDRLEARRSLGLPPDAEVVGYVGTFSAWQGLDTLIEGARLLLAQRPALVVLLVGDGPELPRLQRLAEPMGAHVRFLGRVPHEQVCRTLSACDVLAAPFPPIERNRRMGISALKLGEYLALGRPMLSSRLPGLEFIEEEQVGALFDPGNPPALAVQLAALLSLPPAQRDAIDRRARTLAETTFSWAQIVEDLVGFVENL
ncbi:MAG: glycosyltransferase family 4 protein [Chloroflexaceae bacterium]|nr:glycosyltransferase family 4 protein [Chloroflexaceae bacterium]